MGTSPPARPCAGRGSSPLLPSAPDPAGGAGATAQPHGPLQPAPCALLGPGRGVFPWGKPWPRRSAKRKLVPFLCRDPLASVRTVWVRRRRGGRSAGAALQGRGRLSASDAEGPSSEPSSSDPSLCRPRHVLGSRGQPAVRTSSHSCPGTLLPSCALAASRPEPRCPETTWMAWATGLLGVPSPAWGPRPPSPGRSSPPGTALPAPSPLRDSVATASWHEVTAHACRCCGHSDLDRAKAPPSLARLPEMGLSSTPSPCADASASATGTLPRRTLGRSR